MRKDFKNGTKEKELNKKEGACYRIFYLGDFSASTCFSVSTL